MKIQWKLRNAAHLNPQLNCCCLSILVIVETPFKPAIRKWCTLEAQRPERKQSIVYFGLYVGHVRVVHPVDPKHDPWHDIQMDTRGNTTLLNANSSSCDWGKRKEEPFAPWNVTRVQAQRDDVLRASVENDLTNSHLNYLRNFIKKVYRIVSHELSLPVRHVSLSLSRWEIVVVRIRSSMNRRVFSRWGERGRFSFWVRGARLIDRYQGTISHTRDVIQPHLEKLLIPRPLVTLPCRLSSLYFATRRRKFSSPPKPPFTHNNFSHTFVRFDKTCTARGIE